MRPMQIVRGPCDINGPLAESSLWPYESIVFPWSAVPQGAFPIVKFGAGSITAQNEWFTILEFTPGQNQEGRILRVGTDEVNAAGTTYVTTAADIEWQVAFANGTNGTTFIPIPNFDPVFGSIGSVSVPRSWTFPVKSGARYAVQARTATAGNRYLRAVAEGWLSAFTGGGSIKAGFSRF